jgi:hypothetical protein
MVMFNDPVPVENPALQAVLMALEMRVAIEELMQKSPITKVRANFARHYT